MVNFCHVYDYKVQVTVWPVGMKATSYYIRLIANLRSSAEENNCKIGHLMM